MLLGVVFLCMFVFSQPIVLLRTTHLILNDILNMPPTVSVSVTREHFIKTSIKSIMVSMPHT